MAIQTAGFGVDVMPRYTAPNPSLVAFNPSQFTNGMQQAYDLATAIENLKAKKSMQAELAMTRQKRIEAENAKNTLGAATDTAGLGMIQPRNDLELAKIQSGQRLVEPLEKETLARANFNTQKDNIFSQNLSLLGQVEEQKARADLRSIEPITNQRIAEANLGTRVAEKEGSLLDKKFQKIDQELDNAIRYAPTNAAIEMATKNANLQKIAAETEYMKEHAKSLGVKDGNLATLMNAASNERNRILNQRVTMPDGKTTGTLGQYMEYSFRNPETSFYGFNKKPLQHSPYIKSQIRALDEQEQLVNRINKRIQDKYASQEGLDIEQPAATPTNAENAQVFQAIQWLQANPNDPRANAVRKKLKDQGYIQ